MQGFKPIIVSNNHLSVRIIAVRSEDGLLEMKNAYTLIIIMIF
jgi:hypothetical protein